MGKGNFPRPRNRFVNRATQAVNIIIIHFLNARSVVQGDIDRLIRWAIRIGWPGETSPGGVERGSGTTGGGRQSAPGTKSLPRKTR